MIDFVVNTPTFGADVTIFVLCGNDEINGIVLGWKSLEKFNMVHSSYLFYATKVRTIWVQLWFLLLAEIRYKTKRDNSEIFCAVVALASHNAFEAFACYIVGNAVWRGVSLFVELAENKSAVAFGCFFIQ